MQVNTLKMQVNTLKMQVDTSKMQVDALKVQVNTLKMQVHASKDYQEINYPNLVGWTSCPPFLRGGRDAHPTRKVECFLFVSPLVQFVSIFGKVIS